MENFYFVKKCLVGMTIQLSLVIWNQNSAFEEDDIVNLDVEDERMISNEEFVSSRW
jgi:hypothetical protein